MVLGLGDAKWTFIGNLKPKIDIHWDNSGFGQSIWYSQRR